ncbi:hypothetical protein [Neisseria animalis]|uniref:Uncharacterized protein n=1 Tax=Neisseria animalis TaxID=492 RepID=A0A5P3MST1_NEIAN|nr:hypothetical protein [Neisseria animalis]QEY24145.1 hypothetical protein D0T90_06275 [Neisseria animalis]ROW31497.1 hypothetical protein CGZ60_09855 [Neisseria animalis]VEE06374.1 Uncharacterised protein [Neisseria animalis]
MNIFQIYYLESQQAGLDKGFVPVYNRPNGNEKWFEYGVMRYLWQHRREYFQGLTGVFSHKFYEKTGLSSDEVKAFVEKNSGGADAADVYLFNPITAPSHLFANQWLQGGSYHKGLVEVTQNILDILRIPVHLNTLMDTSGSVVYCNYWVGSPKFWQAYMDFAEMFYHMIEGDTENRLGAQNLVAHSGSHSYPMIPFIFERLPTLFLRLNPQFKCVAYEYPDEMLRKRWGMVYHDMMAMKQAKDLQNPTAFYQVWEQLRAKVTREQLLALYAQNACPDVKI